MTRFTERLQAQWDAFFFAGYSVKSLGALRVAIGLGFIFYQFSEFFALLDIHSGPTWLFLSRVWYFRALGFERLLPVVCWCVFAVMLLATLSMVVGRWTRASIGLVMATSIYLQGARDSVVGDTHHRLLIWTMIFFFLLLSDCGQAYSLDAVKRPSKAEEAPIPEWRASWPIRAMQLYTVSFYLWSAVAKLRVSGLSWVLDGGKVQESLLSRSAMWGLDDQGQALGNRLAFAMAHQPQLLEGMSALVLLMEAGFPLVLFLRSNRMRLLFLGGVAVFHVANFILLYVGFLLMPLAFVIFFDMEPVARRVRTWRIGRFIASRVLGGAPIARATAD